MLGKSMIHSSLPPRCLALVVAAVLAASGRVSCEDAKPLPWVEGSTTIVALPDTERYSDDYPHYKHDASPTEGAPSPMSGVYQYKSRGIEDYQYKSRGIGSWLQTNFWFNSDYITND